MKNLSTGTGLALLATAIVAYPVVNRISSVDQTAHASVPLAAIAAAATAQANPEPTIVWYQSHLLEAPTSSNGGKIALAVVRAWSNGAIELRVRRAGLNTQYGCEILDYGGCSQWVLISSPEDGFRSAADLNGNEIVDGADLATILSNWGDAPRYDIPPSDCPLNLINP